MNSVPLLFPLPATVVQSLSQPTAWKKFSIYQSNVTRAAIALKPQKPMLRFLVGVPAVRREIAGTPACSQIPKGKTAAKRTGHFELRCRILWKYLLRSMAAQLTARITGSGPRLTYFHKRLADARSRMLGCCSSRSWMRSGSHPSDLFLWDRGMHVLRYKDAGFPRKHKESPSDQDLERCI